MALPANPPISLAQVRAEFGAPAGTPLHAFVRGGAWVPNSAANSGVPTSPPIRLAQLCGAANYTPLSVSASGGRSTYNGRGTGAPTNVTVSATVTVTASGGSGTKTYSVSKVSGDTIAFTGGNTSTPDFSANLGRNQTVSGVYRFTVTDGQSTNHADVTVSLQYIWIDA